MIFPRIVRRVVFPARNDGADEHELDRWNRYALVLVSRANRAAVILIEAMAAPYSSGHV